MAPALQDGFLTAGPPGTYPHLLIYSINLLNPNPNNVPVTVLGARDIGTE